MWKISVTAVTTGVLNLLTVLKKNSPPKTNKQTHKNNRSSSSPSSSAPAPSPRHWTAFASASSCFLRSRGISGQSVVRVQHLVASVTTRAESSTSTKTAHRKKGLLFTAAERECGGWEEVTWPQTTVTFWFRQRLESCCFQSLAYDEVPRGLQTVPTHQLEQ